MAVYYSEIQVVGHFCGNGNQIYSHCNLSIISMVGVYHKQICDSIQRIKPIIISLLEVWYALLCTLGEIRVHCGDASIKIYKN